MSKYRLGHIGDGGRTIEADGKLVAVIWENGTAHCEALIAAANRAEAERWVSVKERLPEDDRTVLLWTNENYHTYDDPRVAILGRYVASLKEWRLQGSNSNWSDAVTHWCPLPAAPKEVQS